MSTAEERAKQAVKDHVKKKVKKKAQKVRKRVFTAISSISPPLLIGGIAAFIVIGIFAAFAAISIVDAKQMMNEAYKVNIPANVLQNCLNEHTNSKDKVDFVTLLSAVCTEHYGRWDATDAAYISGLAEKMKNGETLEYDPEFKDMLEKVFGGMIGDYEQVTKEIKDVTIEDGGKTKYKCKMYASTPNGPVYIDEVFLTIEELNALSKNGYFYSFVNQEVVTRQPAYGVKACFPIAKGYTWSHSDDFGDPRDYGGIRNHEGNDILADIGTPLLAVEDGEVYWEDYGDTGGFQIGLRADSGREYWYSHMDHFHSSVKVGTRVRAGDVVGYCGDTGYGPEVTHGKFVPHLHLQVGINVDGEKIWINPYPISEFLKSHEVQVEQRNQDGNQDYYGLN